LERTEAALEYQDIIHAAGRERLPEINVLEQVMGRIAKVEDRRSVLQRAMRSTTVLGSIAALIMMVSMTAYAATEYIQIRNKTGTVKVQYVAPTVRDAGMAQSGGKYAKQAEAFAEPGELIAYYVKGKAEPALHFQYKKRRISAYADFLQEVGRTGAPRLPKTALGYTFEYGDVYPSVPVTAAEKSGALYQDALRELTARAAESDGKEKVFMKAVQWSNPVQVSGIYSRGKSRIGIFAMLMHEGNMYVEQELENKTEKLTVAGVEVVYNSVNKEYVSYNYLNWYNEEQDAYYTITNMAGKELTKTQLLQLAKELLEQGKK